MTTGILTSSPGSRTCSTKQKQSTFIKTLPALGGETLYVAVPVEFFDQINLQQCNI